MKRLAILFLTILTIFSISACKKKEVSDHIHSYESSEVAATCEKRGYTLYACSCGDSYKDNYVDTIAHSYVDGKCVTCTSNDESKGLEYKYLLDNTYEVVSLGECIDMDIVIPSIYNGLPVSSIGKDAFKEEEITSIVIPEGVKTIKSGAFYGCYSLKEISIPNSIEEVGDVGYESCENLKMNTFNGTYYLGNANNPYALLVRAQSNGIKSVIINKNTVVIGDNAFCDCTYLSKVEFPLGSELRSISDYAFYECQNLEEIYLPKNLKSIGNSAFCYCYGLETINFPKGIEKIGYKSFYGTDYNYNTYMGLNYVKVGSNPYFACVSTTSSTSTITFHKDTKIISTGVARDNSRITSVIFEEGIEIDYIPDRCFYNCDSLEGIVIPEGVKKIGDYVFAESAKLTNITIPNTLEDISTYAFSTIPSLTLNEYNNAGYIGNEENPYLVLYKSLQTTITDVTINANTKCVYRGAFNDNTSLASITFEENSKLEFIHPYAFNDCELVTSITIPKTVKVIDDYAFGSCGALESIAFEEGSSLCHIGDEAFQYSKSLKSFIMPDSVKSIGENVLSYSSNLETVKLSNGLNSINSYTFYEDSKLSSVILPSNLEYIGCEAFYECYALSSLQLPDRLDIIGEKAFYDSGITTVNIPQGILSIGEKAFTYCDALTGNKYDNAYYLGNEENPYLVLYKASNNEIESCKINANAVYIHSYAFEYCSNLKDVTFEEDSKLEYVQTSAFQYSSSLVNISFPESVNKMGEYVFEGCESLEDFRFPSAIKEIPDGTFYECTSLTTYTVQNGITKIGSGAFGYCESLMEINIPNSVKEIDSYAFYDCKSLVAINIPSSVKIISEGVFESCISLSKIEIPSSIIEIDEGAFRDCNSLTEVVLPESVITISQYAFSGCENLNCVILPLSLEYVGTAVISDCNEDTVLCYKGTSEDWNNVTSYTSLEGIRFYSNCVHTDTEWTYIDGKVVSKIQCSEWVGTDSTCILEGTKTSTCNICGDTIRKTEPLKDHIIVDGICTECGMELPYVIENDEEYPFIFKDGVLQSTNKSHSSSSTYTLTMTKAAKITFKYKVSSETSYDKLKIDKNGSNLITVSGTNNEYKEYSIELVAGDKLTFTYSKDGSATYGDDCAYIKDLRFEAIEGVI